MFGRRHGDAQGTTGGFVHFTDGFFGFFDGRDDLSAAAIIGLSEFGKVDGSGGAGDELGSETFFEAGYPSAECGFGDLELFGSSGKAGQFNDFDECGHLVLAAHVVWLQGIRGLRERRGRDTARAETRRSLHGKR